MKKFEYQVYRASHISEEKLQQMGMGGWQLQCVSNPPEATYATPFTYYFMREIDDPRERRDPESA